MTGIGQGLEWRTLVLAPAGRDALLTRDMLGRHAVDVQVCHDGEELRAELPRGAAAVVITEEALTTDTNRMLADFVAAQPSWSDLPILLLTRHGANSSMVTAAVGELGNVSLLERPVRMSAMLSAVSTAHRARARQYELRDQFEAQAQLAAIVTSSDDAIVSKTLEGASSPGTRARSGCSATRRRKPSASRSC